MRRLKEVDSYEEKKTVAEEKESQKILSNCRREIVLGNILRMRRKQNERKREAPKSFYIPSACVGRLCGGIM